MSLAQAMKDRGLTDQTLADKVGVSRPFITRIRLGLRKPSIDIAAKLEDATGVPAAEFANTDRPSPEASHPDAA